MDNMINLVLLIFDPIAAMVFVWAVVGHSVISNFPKHYKFGMTLAAAGLLAQALRSYETLFTGVPNPGGDLIFLAAKDLALVLLAYSVLPRARSDRH